MRPFTTRFRKIATVFTLLILLFLACTAEDCGSFTKESASDKAQRVQQEVTLKAGSDAVGLPNIKNFREKRTLKEILELCDQDGLTTYVYLWSEVTGKATYLGVAVGYGIPYATQYTNPQKPLDGNYQGEFTTIPQADPNTLFKPDTADGTWVLLKDPNSGKVSPVLVEPKMIVSPFRLPKNIVIGGDE